MSQTNLFTKANMPDVVYFDLQSTNVSNNSVNPPLPLRFVESRDAPIIQNSGDYYMNINRFSLDTYNLPVLLVEPDLADPFDPQRSIHKVAIMTDSANLKLDTPTVVDRLRFNTSTPSELAKQYGYCVSMSNDGNIIAIGAPASSYQYIDFTTGVLTTVLLRGRTYIGVKNTDSAGYSVTEIEISYTGQLRFGTSVSLSGDGTVLVIGTGGVASATLVPEATEYAIYNVQSGTIKWFDKYSSESTAENYASSVFSAINYDGSIIALGYPNYTPTSGGTVYGRYELIRYNKSAGTKSQLLSVNNTTSLRAGTALALSGSGAILAVTTNTGSGGGTVDVRFTTNDWTSQTLVSTGTIAKGFFGTSLSMSLDGLFFVVGAPTEATNGVVQAFTLNTSGAGTITSATVLSPASPVNTGSSAFGTSVALSGDGLTLQVGAVAYNGAQGAVQSFTFAGGSFTFRAQSTGFAPSVYYGASLANGADGNLFIVGAPSDSYGHAQVRALIYTSNTTLPSNLVNVASVVNVHWLPDNLTPTPSRTELNGRNTAQFRYYYCNSYNNFIDRVNVALREAYVENFTRLWDSWISTLPVTSNNTFIKAEFLNVVARNFPNPPFLDWNTSSLDATMYLNTLFSVVGNYYQPARTWNIVSTNRVSQTAQALPFHFKVAMNASLYALFNSFPAVETVINNEKFFILSMPEQVPTLRDFATVPIKSLSLVPDYNFLYPYYNASANEFTIPYPSGSVPTYSLEDYMIVFKQELSTIDTWCPINAIVFTSNTLPIVINQFSAVTTIGAEATPSAKGNEFALIITDLASNQQGFRPNVLYTPSAEFRRIDLTGNLPIRVIDINVFWRSKTGQLLPFYLGSGGSASLKIMFDKKIKGEKQKIQFDELKVK